VEEVEGARRTEVKPAALTLTVAVHAVVFAFALVRCSPEVVTAPPPPPQGPASQPQTLDVRLLPSYPDGFDEMPCDASYRGIGILSMDGTISNVSPGGPADRAGLRVHDFILNFSDLGQDRYMVGHRLILRVRREGAVIHVPVVISRICFE
jgi:predicted metalloprotease with PDZ domain